MIKSLQDRAAIRTMQNGDLKKITYLHLLVLQLLEHEAQLQPGLYYLVVREVSRPAQRRRRSSRRRHSREWSQLVPGLETRNML
jgi:hypothetical protein